ncbi:MAG TPA: hypothetical protein VGJ92_09340 [Methanocella sp.]
MNIKWVIVLVTVILCLLVSGCDTPTPTPSSNYGSDYGANSNSNGGYATDTNPYGGYSTVTPEPDSTYMPPATDSEAGDMAVMDAASAIQFNDPDAFTALMSAETLTHVSGTPDLTTPEAQKIGEALQNAHVVNSAEDAFVYETTIDGVTITFMVIKEDGAWKISGL